MMKRAALILARGFEESEALSMADILRRADLILIFSYTGSYFDYQDMKPYQKQLSVPRIWMVSGGDQKSQPYVDRVIRFQSPHDQICHPYRLQFVAGLIAQEYAAQGGQ